MRPKPQIVTFRPSDKDWERIEEHREIMELWTGQKTSNKLIISWALYELSKSKDRFRATLPPSE